MTDQYDINIEGDVILIHHQDKPTLYARIEEIAPDVKKDWYQVTLLFLTVPSQVVTWILKEEYINGSTFTMGGQPMRLEKVKRTLSKNLMSNENGKLTSGLEKEIDFEQNLKLGQEVEEKHKNKIIPFKRRN